MQVHVVSKTLYTKTLSIEFHLITGIVCVVNSANKLMKGHTTYFKPLRGSALLCYLAQANILQCPGVDHTFAVGTQQRG